MSGNGVVAMIVRTLRLIEKLVVMIRYSPEFTGVIFVLDRLKVLPLLNLVLAGDQDLILGELSSDRGRR